MKKIVLITTVLCGLSFTFKNKKFKGPEGYVFIPSGSIEMEGQIYSCAAFWMSDHEVTNAEYREFLDALKAEGKMEDYNKAVPDTAAWNEIGGFMDPMKKHYFSHPTYANYPVVNISKQGAIMYCKYVTEQYLSIYGNVIQEFRLPTRMEWMYAAASGTINARYPWNGPYLRNEDGDLMANFRQVGDHNITLTENGPEVVNDSLRYREVILDDVFITAPVNSYWPNDYGLYNMSGNVAEMVSKEDVAVGGDWHVTGYDIRITAKKKFDKPSPFVGFRPVMSFMAEKN
jgi:formylglycine-generating enzyme required for sulfatase activity